MKDFFSPYLTFTDVTILFTWFYGLFLSFFAVIFYNGSIPQKFNEGDGAMMEFGEKLKKVREEKGMTQQTLADHLYVTRQAVSRWECGARYPDLMTAKKLADFLETSLDELLSGEEMKQCVENNPVLEKPRGQMMQSILYAAAAVPYLLLFITELKFLFLETSVLDGGTMTYVLSFVLGYGFSVVLMALGLVLSMQGRMTPRKTGAVVAAFFGIRLLQALFVYTQVQSIPFSVVRVGFYLICIAVIVFYYYQNRRIWPVPMYVIIGVWGALRIWNYYQAQQHNTEAGFILSTIGLLADLGLAALMIYQAYSLERKWHYAVR